MEICNKEDCSVVKNHQELLEYLIEKQETEIKRLQEDMYNQKILNIINSNYGIHNRLALAGNNCMF